MGPFMEASENQLDCSGVRKIVWRANMEKTAWRKIMAIYGDWRIFRRILKCDLAFRQNVGSAAYGVIWSAMQAACLQLGGDEGCW